jgi:hypothetical protein
MKNGWMLRSQNKGKNGPTLPKTACVYTVRRMSHRCPDQVKGIQCTKCIDNDGVAQVLQDRAVAFEERAVGVQRQSRNRGEAVTSMCEE